MNKPIIGDYTELIVGNSCYHYSTDMSALEVAESLPDCVRWKVRLQNNKGLIDSERYRNPNGNFTPTRR